MEKLVKVGVMPGRISEVVVEIGSTVAQVLAIAEVNADGYEIKVDGVVASLDTKVTESTNLVLLTKQIKGNALVKVGVMPGRVNEVYVEDSATVAQILAVAEVNADGYEVKVDGVKVTDFNTVAGTAGLILLTKQIKGNK
jgi:hypothetical protein